MPKPSRLDRRTIKYTVTSWRDGQILVVARAIAEKADATRGPRTYLICFKMDPKTRAVLGFDVTLCVRGGVWNSFIGNRGRRDLALDLRDHFLRSQEYQVLLAARPEEVSLE